MLAYHFHDEIVWQGLIAPFVILAALFIVAVRVDRSDRARRLLFLGLGCLVALAGVYALAELPALSHNHLCHAHSSDNCDIDHDGDDHTHWYWFGGRAAKPRSPGDRVPFSPPPAHHTCTTALPQRPAPLSASAANPQQAPLALSTQTTSPPPFPGCPQPNTPAATGLPTPPPT